MTTLNERISLENAQIITMRELNQNTAQVIQRINDSREPALVTRHGRFIAMITPLEGAQIETLVMPSITARYAGPVTDEPTLSSDEVIASFDGQI